MLKGIDETQQIHNICILKSIILAITKPFAYNCKQVTLLYTYVPHDKRIHYMY